MIANRDIQRRLASFVRAEADRSGTAAAIDPRRFYAAMASRFPARHDRADAVDAIMVSQTPGEAFLLRA